MIFRSCSMSMTNHCLQLLTFELTPDSLKVYPAFSTARYFRPFDFGRRVGKCSARSDANALHDTQEPITAA